MSKNNFIHLSYGETTVCIDHKKKVIVIDTPKIDSHFIMNFIERMKNIEGANFLELSEYEFDFNQLSV